MASSPRLVVAHAPGRSLGLGLAVPALLALCLAFAVVAVGKEAPLAAADPVVEKRMLRLAAELRCLVCQNQTIADSHAPLAEDLRRQVREMIARGESDAQIIDFMTKRYGDFVLYRPPLKGSTAALWFGPFALLLGGLTIFVLVLRRRSRLAADQFEPDELDDAPPSQR
jgi:cytochrome c-type biogenesis protein CcmH